MAAIKYINPMGYVVLTQENELEHRFVAKQILERDLKSNEVVHHINGNKTDNELKNLCVIDSEKHELFHSWLIWKKNKSGSYPSINHQKKILEQEYGGILLEKLKPVPAIIENNESSHDDLERFVVRRNWASNKLFIEFDEEALISPDGKVIEIDEERFSVPEEVYESDLTEKQLQVLQNKIKSRESKAVQDSKQLELQKNLFNELRRERKRLADEAGIPAYLVFDDKTLIEMSEIMPDTEAMMLQVRGVGSFKFQKYGSHFIGIVVRFKRKQRHP